MLDITTLAAWGEFIGGIAVVVSLIYLAGQIRINTKTVRASNFGDLLTANNEATAISDAESASLWVRGIGDYAALDAEDRVRFDSMMSPHLNLAYRAWNLHQAGLLDASMLENLMRGVASYLEEPGARQWWETKQQFWQSEFREFVQARAPE